MAPGIGLIDDVVVGPKPVPFEFRSKNAITNGAALLPFENDEQFSVQKRLEELSKHDNPALYVTPQHSLEMRSNPIPQPSPTQVLIHVRCTGICGSDVHLWHRGAIGHMAVTCPSVLGHEASGVVLAIGSSVTNLKPGDKVALEPGVPCGDCFLCKAGKYNLCANVAFAGMCPYAGSIQRFMVHEAQYCHKMPDSMTFSQGALLEPLSVIMHAISQCNGSIGIGRPALVCGAGPIGLIGLAAARASGAWPLVITDVDESRLHFAENFVPGVLTYHIETSKTPLQCADELRQLYGCGYRDVEKGIFAENEYAAPNTVLECTGIESSIITAAYSCRRSGTVMVVGVGRSIMHNLPFMHLSLAEIDLRFINRYRDTWPAGINALSNHSVMNLDSLVTHTLPLEQAREALELSADRTKRSIKVQIVDDTEIPL